MTMVESYSSLMLIKKKRQM